MEVQITDLDSTVQLDARLSPQHKQEIVNLVLQVVDEREAHHQQVRAEQRITRGINYELEESE